MDETLEILPKQNEVTVEVLKNCRQECEICGKDAHFKHTFLLKGTRSNPASRAYQRDDCSWCEDGHTFACPDCKSKVRPPEGYVDCSVFSAGERFAHLFLVEQPVEISDELKYDLNQQVLKHGI